MPSKKTPPTSRPVWRPSDIAASTVGRKSGRKTSDALEVGAQAIYRFRSHPGKARWEKAAAETRAAYRARMQELVNELAAAGYEIVPAMDG